jgi:hypothetical protein
MQQYIDNMAISTTRVYPSTIVEISGDGGSTWTYQPPTSLSETSIQITASLPTLTAANYILRVTNNSQLVAGTTSTTTYTLGSGSGGGGGGSTTPTVTSFTLPSTSYSLIIPINTFTATDDVGVTGYCVTTTNSSSGCTWVGSAPTSLTGIVGLNTYYAWAEDAANNISSSVSASTTITLPTVGGSLICKGCIIKH